MVLPHGSATALACAARMAYGARMSPVKDIAELGKRVAARHGWPAARAFKTYEMNDRDRAILAQAAIDLLTVFPAVPDAAAPLSAALAVELERRMSAPVQVVAGTLAVEGAPVFEGEAPGDGLPLFGPSQGRWDGHVWVMVGPYVVDASLFRMAYSREAPARLAKHVDLMFGPGKGLYVDRWKRALQQGLSYQPQYVLGAEEVTFLMGRAFHLIKQGQAD